MGSLCLLWGGGGPGGRHTNPNFNVKTHYLGQPSELLLGLMILVSNAFSDSGIRNSKVMMQLVQLVYLVLYSLNHAGKQGWEG